MSDQIDVNQLSNALQTKVDLPSGKNQSDIDYVVESQLPTAENNYTWYRLYKSGWVEQGGVGTTTSGTNKTVTLLKEMSDSNYSLNVTVKTSTGSAEVGTMSITTTTFIINVYGSGTSGYSWEVKGMSAQGGNS